MRIFAYQFDTMTSRKICKNEIEIEWVPHFRAQFEITGVVTKQPFLKNMWKSNQRA